MSTMKELMDRGIKLAEKYSVEILKDKLKDALAIGDGEERLAIQYALKQKENTSDGYAYTIEQQNKMNEKLEV